MIGIFLILTIGSNTALSSGLALEGELIVKEDFPADGAWNKFPGVKPVIPMNTEDPSYNLWKTKRANLSEGREAGPINIQRYPGGMGFTGIPSFFRLPVALTPEDLKAGDVDVALLGAYTNMGNGARGAQRGPVALRASQAEYSPWGALTMAHTGTMVNPFSDMTIVDYGDAPHDPLSTMRTNEGVRAIVREITEVKRKDGSHVIPFIIGGDHSLAYPDIAAVTDVYGKGKVGVIHFDAHFDGTMAMGHLAGHGMWVRQLINEGFVPGKTIFKLDCEVIILMPEHSSGCVNRGFVITPWLRLMTVAGIS